MWTFITIVLLIIIALLLIFFVIGYVSMEKEKSEKIMMEAGLERCKKEVIRHRNRLSANEKVTKIIKSFMMKYDPRIFASSYHIMAFERYLYEIYPNSRELLWSAGYHATPYMKIDTSTTYYPNRDDAWFFQPIDTFEKDLKHCLRDGAMLNQSERFYKNEFSQLLEIIKSYEDFKSDEIATLTLWLLLREGAVTYYADVFAERYEEKYFSNLSHLNVEQCVEIFLEYIWGQNKSNEELLDQVEKKKKFNWEFFYIEGAYTISFSCFLMQKKKMKVNNLLHADFKINELLQRMVYSDHWHDQMKKKIISELEDHLLNSDARAISSHMTIHEVDLMDGFEFEHFVTDLFRKMGYDAEVTKASGDQGIDIIANKNGQSFGVQVKRYASAVSNKAVQEVVAGLNYYELDQGIVITNNTFTKSAQELAEANNILLWDREVLKDKINAFMN